jgi:hypothetical protein
MRKLMMFVAIVITIATHAQQQEDFRYMRGSLCMMMVENPLSEYKPEIKKVFEEMEIPNRFNDHRFGKVRLLKFPNRDNMELNLEVFARDNELGKRLVGKWFGHSRQTDGFNTEMLRERGLDNATVIDIKEALKTVRGKARLEDMGENLISHTYWVVTDFEYHNHKNLLSTIVDVVQVMEGGTRVFSGGLDNLDTMLKQSDKGAAKPLSSLFDEYNGFKMKATSYLFRLKWNEEIANTFYSEYYTETPQQEASKLTGFQNDKNLFSVEYVGKVENTSTKMSVFGVSTKEQLIQKICTRALDKNIADLQHKFPDFRIKAPLISTNPIKAYVGLKEDISLKSRYEVFLPMEDENGITKYKRIGVIKPIKGRIWDNQFMADLEQTAASSMNATYFEKESGGDFAPGMLIREIK